MTDSITIREARTAEELEQAQEIRVRVFEEEQGIPHELNVDGADQAAYHLLVLDHDLPVATARLSVTGEREGVIARIAVLPSHRGRGLGRHLIQELESLARRVGLQALSMEPHAHLEAFYQALGYETVPGSVEVAGYRLIRMTKNV